MSEPNVFDQTREMLTAAGLPFFPADIPAHRWRWSPDVYDAAVALMESFGARQPSLNPQCWGYPVVVDDALTVGSVVLESRG